MNIFSRSVSKIWLLKLGLVSLGVVVSTTLFAAEALPAAKQEQAASKEECSAYPAIVYSNHTVTVQGLRHLYQVGNFSELDDSLACLMRSSQKFSSGKSGSSAVYWTFRRQMPAPGAQPSESSVIQRWKQERPQSMFAEFAELRLRYATAWNTRGSGYASDVPRPEWKAFHEGLLATELALLEARAPLRRTPIWQNLLLALVLDEPQSRTPPGKVFNNGVKQWPDYYDFYEVALSRMVPKWGGDWDSVDAFIVAWSARLKKSEGDSLYARLYTSVIANGTDPHATKLSWPRMRSSLDELVERYPDYLHKNLAASFACAYRDKALLKKMLPKIAPNEMDHSVWINGTHPVNCEQWMKE